MHVFIYVCVCSIHLSIELVINGQDSDKVLVPRINTDVTTVAHICDHCCTESL